MAHFAELDNFNNVLRVIVIHNDELLDDNGVESEEIGIQFCKSLYGEDTNWKQTSYNGNIRKNYAGYGYKYDISRDAFIAPQPWLSWILNQESLIWESPVPYPADGEPSAGGKSYYWDETLVNWVEIPQNI